MTQREKEIFQLISQQPTIDQNEIAARLNITRSSVAVHISNLQKKGYIRGRGYLINERDYVVGIGAANVDIHCRSKDKLVMQDSNPSHMHMSLGGVTRNICENLARLDTKVKLITALGDDSNGAWIRDTCQMMGIDMNYSMVVNQHRSSTYISCLDEQGDMFVAFSDMEVLQQMNMRFLQSRDHIIHGAKLIVCDPALPEEVLAGITERYGKKMPIFCDPVSTAYAKRLRPFVGCLHTVKPNRMELAVLSGHPTETDEDLMAACDKLLGIGTQRVIVSLGKRGCLYMDQEGNRIQRGFRPLEKMVNATGGGDAFMAAVIYSYVNDYTAENTVDLALAAGCAAVSSADTINPDMSLELLKKTIKERK